MDAEAAGRARRKGFQRNLADAYTDEEACPPEWAELLVRAKDAAAQIHRIVDEETQRFATEPDVRKALARRERAVIDLRNRVDKHNAAVRRLNLIAPLPRLQRHTLEAEEVLRPLFRTPRP